MHSIYIDLGGISTGFQQAVESAETALESTRIHFGYPALADLPIVAPARNRPFYFSALTPC